jgi:hypothetical protein
MRRWSSGGRPVRLGVCFSDILAGNVLARLRLEAVHSLDSWERSVELYASQ